MPLTKKGKKILAAMKQQFGEEKGKQVFFASANKGTITGVEQISVERRRQRRRRRKQRQKRIARMI